MGRFAPCRWYHRVLPAIVLMVGTLTSVCAAGPPRILDEEEDAIRPAALSQPEELPPNHLISPRSRGESSSPKSATRGKSAGNSMPLWGTVLGLGAVFGLFFAARIWLTRHGPAGFRGLPVEALELLGKRVIEPRVSIHLVRCGPKILVLGVAPDGVRTLTEITDPVEIDLLAGACRRKDVPVGASFTGMFRQAESAARPAKRGEAS